MTTRTKLWVPLVVIGAAAGAGCGPRATQSTEPAVRRPVANAGGASREVVRLPPADTSLPANAVLTASVSIARLEPLVAAFFNGSREGQRIRELIERGAAQAPGSLASGRIVTALGLDPARPMMFGVAPVEGASQAAVDALRGVLREVEAGQASDLAARVRRAFGNEGVAARARLVVPSVDVGATKRALDALLDVGLTPVEPPPGVERMYLSPDSGLALALVRADDAVVLELLQLSPTPEAHETAARAAFAALRARGAGASASASASAASSDAIARVAFAPAALAGPGFAMGVASALRAVAQVSVAQPAVDQILAAGLREAGRVFTLAGDAQGAAYFDRVELEVAGPAGAAEVRGRAQLGAAQPAGAPDAAVWAQSTGVDMANSSAVAEVASAWAAAWTLPGETAGQWLHRPRAFDLVLREAGAAGFVVALPHVLAWGAQMLGRDALPRDQQTRAALVPRLDRAGVFHSAPTAGSVSYLLLTANTTAAQAGCVLAPPGPRGCTARTRMRPNGPPVAMGNRGESARLVAVGNRFVVLTSYDAGALSALVPSAVTLSPRPRAPVHIELETARLARDRELRPLAALASGRYALSVARDGQVISFEARPMR